MNSPYQTGDSSLIKSSTWPEQPERKMRLWYQSEVELYLYRGGGDSKVENLSADFRFFFACMLPVGVGKNKNSRGRKKNGHHGHYFGGLVGKKKI